jgi:hypothetical protein
VALGWAYVVDTARSFALLGLAPLALLSHHARKPAGALLVAALCLLASFLRSGGDLFDYGRLFVPLVPGLFACAAIGLMALGVRLDARMQPLLLAPLLAWGLFVAREHALAPSHGFPNVERWSVVGRYLGCAHPGSRVATVPIGAISYFSRLPIIDLVGLTAREVAKAGRSVPPGKLIHAWIGHERNNTEWVLSQRPDLIVLGTKYSSAPVSDVNTMRAGFYAEWLLLSRAKQGSIPYRAYSPQIAPGVYWHMLRAAWLPASARAAECMKRSIAHD